MAVSLGENLLRRKQWLCLHLRGHTLQQELLCTKANAGYLGIAGGKERLAQQTLLYLSSSIIQVPNSAPS